MQRARFERPEQNPDSSGSELESIPEEISPVRPAPPGGYRVNLPRSAVSASVVDTDGNDFEKTIDSPYARLLNPVAERPSFRERLYNRCCRKRPHSAITQQNLAKVLELTTHSPKYRRQMSGASLSSLVSPMHSFHMDSVIVRQESQRLGAEEPSVEDFGARPALQMKDKEFGFIRFDENVSLKDHIAALVPPRVLRDWSADDLQSVFDDYSKLLDYEDSINMVAFEICLAAIQHYAAQRNGEVGCLFAGKWSSDTSGYHFNCIDAIAQRDLMGFICGPEMLRKSQETNVEENFGKYFGCLHEPWERMR